MQFDRRRPDEEADQDEWMEPDLIGEQVKPVQNTDVWTDLTFYTNYLIKHPAHST